MRAHLHPHNNPPIRRDCDHEGRAPSGSALPSCDNADRRGAARGENAFLHGSHDNPLSGGRGKRVPVRDSVPHHRDEGDIGRRHCDSDLRLFK